MVWAEWYAAVKTMSHKERERTVRTLVPPARRLSRWSAFEDLGILVDAVRLFDELGTVLASL